MSNIEIYNERVEAYANVILAHPELVKEAAAADLHLSVIVLTPSDRFVSAGGIGIARTGAGAKYNDHNAGMLGRLIGATRGAGCGNGASEKQRRAVATKILAMVDAEEKNVVARLSQSTL